MFYKFFGILEGKYISKRCKCEFNSPSWISIINDYMIFVGIIC